MAMTTPTRGSEAYDLSLFEERPARSLRVVKPSRKALKEQRRRQRVQTVLNTAATLLVVTAICAVVGLMIFNRVRITEINDQIIQKQEELGILESETIRLSNELAAQTSAAEVDTYAAQNGMQKIEAYQLRYITVEAGDKPEVADNGEAGMFESIAAGVTDFFHWVAYLFE
jgi:cell division protein FtsL